MGRVGARLVLIRIRKTEENTMRYDGIVGKGALGLVAVLALSVALVLGAPALAQEEEKGGLAVGEKAPDFSLKGSDGKTYTLAQFKGEKPVVLAFFPKSFTPG